MRPLPVPLPLGLALALALAGAAPALARPTLTGASLAADATASAPRQIALAFSEPVTLPATALTLVMTAMPGMAHHDPMTVTGFATRLGEDRRSLVATLPRALPRGTYRLAWQASGQDGEVARGSYSFTVE